MAVVPFHIGMLVFDQMTNLDFAGPADVFGRVPGVKLTVIAKTTAPVVTDTGLRLLPDVVIAEAAETFDMLFVGGGPGTTELMEDRAVLAFLTDRAERAQWITSVCTGSLVLGAAGLLRGYRATTHWAAIEVLPLLGAIVEEDRVVVDGNRVTGAGVTAGIDFALLLVGMIWGDERAQVIQLAMEYDPQPPYDAGSPRRAPVAIVDRLIDRTAALMGARAAAATRVSRR